MTATNGLLSYTCHKRVRAAKIVSIEEIGTEDRDYYLRFEGTDIAHRVSREWVERHRPMPGGYYVVYDGGAYASFSPAKAFEDGYRLDGKKVQTVIVSTRLSDRSVRSLYLNDLDNPSTIYFQPVVLPMPDDGGQPAPVGLKPDQVPAEIGETRVKVRYVGEFD